MNAALLDGLRLIAEAIIETVRESGPMGAPAGPMYAACMSQLTLGQFEQVMEGLVLAGKLRRQGHVYFVVEA